MKFVPAMMVCVPIMVELTGRRSQASKTDELCIKNEEFYIRNGELCIKNEGFRIKTMSYAGEAPRGLKGNLTAHIEVHPNGQFVYGSNRGHDSIVCFAIDQTTGGLIYIAHTASGGQS